MNYITFRNAVKLYCAGTAGLIAAALMNDSPILALVIFAGACLFGAVFILCALDQQ